MRIYIYIYIYSVFHIHRYVYTYITFFLFFSLSLSLSIYIYMTNVSYKYIKTIYTHMQTYVPDLFLSDKWARRAASLDPRSGAHTHRHGKVKKQ